MRLQIALVDVDSRTEAREVPSGLNDSRIDPLWATDVLWGPRLALSLSSVHTGIEMLNLKKRSLRGDTIENSFNELKLV